VRGGAGNGDDEVTFSSQLRLEVLHSPLQCKRVLLLAIPRSLSGVCESPSSKLNECESVGASPL
jgi:hypothetical protein